MTASKPLSQKTAAGCSEDLDKEDGEVQQAVTSVVRTTVALVVSSLHSWRGQRGDGDAFPLMKLGDGCNTTDCVCQLDHTYNRRATPTIRAHYITVNYGCSPAVNARV